MVSDQHIFLRSAEILHPLLALDLELEVKVRWVEVVQTAVSVLSSTAVHGSERADGDVVERTEVTSYTTNLLLEDLVVETGFEFSLSC